MCFYKDSDGYIHRLAEKDIVCYKYMFKYGDVYLSIQQHFRYVLGEVYNADIYTSNRYSLHELDERSTLEDGVFHSYTVPGIRPYDPRIVRVMCIIPKGIPYWFSSMFHEYASTAIKVVSEVLT